MRKIKYVFNHPTTNHIVTDPWKRLRFDVPREDNNYAIGGRATYLGLYSSTYRGAILNAVYVTYDNVKIGENKLFVADLRLVDDWVFGLLTPDTLFDLLYETTNDPVLKTFMTAHFFEG